MASASSLSPLALTVPVSATVGTNFIRIGTKFNTDPTSCASDYGEFEDYALNVTAACSAPSTQASSLTFSDQASTSQTVSWTRGNGNNVMVVVKAGSSSSDPTNGTSYTANAVYGSGNACGGGYVVYNGTGTSVNVSRLTQGTTYYYDLYEYNSTGTCYNKTELVGSNIAGWCVPTTSSSSDAAGINRVIFSNIDNTDNTNTNNSGVEDFTEYQRLTNIQTGSSYDLSVYGNTNGSYEYHILAWIDWNRDGDFSDANEEYDLGTNYNTSNALTSSSPLSITVPVGALTGSNFIRIAYGYSSNPTSCATSFGEFETYALNITSPLTWTGSSSTVWSNAANWSSGSVPGSSDDVIIADVTNNPVLDATDQVGSITIQNGGVLTLSSSVTLTASYVELQSGGDLVISNGELNCTGKFDHDGDLTMSGSGILDIDGEYESSASATEIITGGTIEVAGEWDGALDNAFTPDDGTIIMNGSSDKNLAQHANSNFHNLTIANSGGDVDVTAALDIDGDLTINASADLDIGGGNANIELAGSFTNNGTFTTSGETITFDGAAGDKTSSAISDAALDIVVNKTSTGKVTFAGTCSFDEVTVTDGILAITSNTMTADNTISINDGAELEIGTGTFNADGTINANTTGEIDFTDAGKLICSSSITSLEI